MDFLCKKASDEYEAKERLLRIEDWNSGVIPWIIDCVCPYGGIFPAHRELVKILRDSGVKGKVRFLDIRGEIMNFVILEFSKTKHNLYNNLDYLGLNPYEQRHFCFHGGMGDPGGGEGSEAEGTGGGVDPGGEEESGYDIGFSTAAQQASAAAAAAGMAAGVDAASLADIADVKALQQAGVTLGPYAGVQDYHWVCLIRRPLLIRTQVENYVASRKYLEKCIPYPFFKTRFVCYLK